MEHNKQEEVENDAKLGLFSDSSCNNEDSFFFPINFYFEESPMIPNIPLQFLELDNEFYEEGIFSVKKDQVKNQFFSNFIDQPGLSKCKYCDKVFSKATALGGHTSKMHPRSKQEQREKMDEYKYEENSMIGKRKRIRKCRLRPVDRKSHSQDSTSEAPSESTWNPI